MSRIVRILGRTKAYFMECKQNMAPMPNPDWYEEKKDTMVNFKNLRKLPLSVHVEVWKTAWAWYKGSFESSFAWGRRRKEDAKKQDAQDKMDVLQGMVKEAREATHNTPEDLDKTKQAIKELLHEIEDNKEEIKSVAQEKLDLIRVSLSEFSSGYREARDQEIKRVMAMDKSMLQNFLSERAGEVKHASSLLSDALLKDDARGTNANAATGNASETATPSAAAAAAAASAGETRGGEEGGNGEQDGVFSDPRALLSRRARGAVDDLLHDPDIERLAGRASGFARGRLLQAEAAARVLKGEDEGGGGGGGGGEGNGVGGVGGGEGGVGRNGVGGVGAVAQVSSGRAGRGGTGGHNAEGSGDAHARGSGGGGGGGGDGEGSETPIISGLAKEAREFVAGKMGQAHDGAREVVEAAMEVRRSHRPVEKESVDRKEGEATREGGGVVDAADGKGGQGASDDTKVGGDGKGGGER